MEQQTHIPEVSLLQFIKHSFKILKNPLPFHHRNFNKYGDIFRLNIGAKNHIFFSRDAQLAIHVLQKNQKNYTKSKIQTKDLAKYVGKGLLTAEGEHWKTQRKLIQPAFHKKNLQQLLDTIQSAINTEYDKIETNKPIDVFPIFNDLAFQTVVKSLFSSAANEDEINRLQHITEEVQKMLVKELRQPYLGWWFKISGTLQHHLDLGQESKDILKRIVNQRQQSSVKYNDLLDMLLSARYDDGSSMEEKQLLDEILILFVAGHETTSNALTFTLQLLALHPEWQDKIYDEIKANEDEQDLMNQVMNSKICQQVIEESMRLYPPVYFIDRVNIEDDNFKDYHFKANSNLLFSVFEIHRHPKLWDQPNDFLPERFEDGGRQFSSQYFPFGAGPRKCIGNNFAMFEMIIAINEIIKRYKIKPEFKSIDILPLITLKPKNAILKFEAR